ncbi:MAG TPA: ABC transporter ATP-binding protein [Candidatus Binatia bacterium]
MAESLLTLRHVTVRHGEHVALQSASLEVHEGEVLALIGPNGAGKSTLLRVMGMLQRPNQGTVVFRGQNALNGNSLELRRRIATVFQEPLLLNATVHQNTALGLKLRGIGRAEIDRRLGPWLQKLSIAHLAARSARTLSGGEAQRTSLARALVLEPELLLLDEPFSALDPASREALLHDFQRIVKETGITTVFVTHDRDEAFTLANRVGVLNQGQLLQLDSRENVFLRPETEDVAEIVGIENRLAGIVETSDGDYVTIRINDLRIHAKGRFSAGTKVVACIRPEEVSLSRAHCEANDLNRLTGKVIAVSPGMTHHRISLRCGGFDLIALVDRKKSIDLTLSEGDELTAVFSPTAVHVIEKKKD